MDKQASGYGLCNMETIPGSNHSYEGSTEENKNVNKSAESVSSSFPFELVETVLAQLSVPDLMVAAANVPKFWRDVIENSKEVWTSIARYSIKDTQIPTKKGRKRSAYTPFGPRNGAPWTFNYTFSNGILYAVRRSDGVEGFIFAPISEKLTLCVLDPKRKTAKYSVNSRFGYGFIDLYDFEGRLVCSKQVTQNDKDVMQRYLSTFNVDVGATVDAMYEARKTWQEKAEAERLHDSRKRKRQETRPNRMHTSNKLIKGQLR